MNVDLDLHASFLARAGCLGNCLFMKSLTVLFVMEQMSGGWDWISTLGHVRETKSSLYVSEAQKKFLVPRDPESLVESAKERTSPCWEGRLAAPRVEPRSCFHDNDGNDEDEMVIPRIGFFVRPGSSSLPCDVPRCLVC